MNVFRKITINTLIASLARIIDTVLALVLVAILTRHLGKEGYGHYTTIVAYVHIFVSLANLGLYNILLRDLGKPGIDEEKTVNNIFALRMIGLLLILPLSILAVFVFPYPPLVKLGVIIATISTVFLSLYQVLIPIFQKRFKIIYVSLSELLGRIVYVGLAALLVLRFDKGLISIVWIMALASFIDFLLIFFFANRFTKIRPNINWKKCKSILKEALPVGASIIFTLIYFRIDTLMLSIMKTPQDVGIYGLSYRILENLIFFPAMFVGFVVPVLSRYVFRKPKVFKKTFQRSLNAILLVAIPVMAGLAVAAPMIVTFLAGTTFIESARVLQILTVAIGLIFLGSLYGQTVIVVKKQFWSMWIYLGGAVFNILANLYFIPRYSYVGAAITTALTELLITIGLVIIVVKTLKYFASYKIALKAIVATLPMAAFLYRFRDLHIIILGLSSILIYGFFIYFIGGFEKEDLKLLFKKTKG